MLGRRQAGKAGQRGWQPPRRKREGWIAALMLSGVVCLAVLLAMPVQDTAGDTAPAYTVAAAAQSAPRETMLPSNVISGFPEGETGYTIAIQDKKLLGGLMLLVDEAHSVPEGFAAPASYSILQRAKGRIACRDTQATLAGDALDALDELFRHARYARHNNMVVFASARSEEQQRIALLDRMSELSRSMTFEEALAKAKYEVETPGCSEHQLPWCVDIRICSAWNALPDTATLEASAAGQWLLAHAWEYGFIQRYPGAGTDSHRAWHFRYVGKGHAAMMYALGTSFEEYLSLLREYGVLTLLDDTGKPSVTVICRQATEGETRFTLPLHGTVEAASYDNCGWALVSSLYQ